MKAFSLTLRSVVLFSLVGLMGNVRAHARLVLVDHTQPKAVIVIGSNASEQARQAATELQVYLRRISGAELRILENSPHDQPTTPSLHHSIPPSLPSPPQILVGQAAARTVSLPANIQIPSGLNPDFNDEGYLVDMRGNTLVLAGNETEPYQGTFFAVYDFLESLGCRWYFPGQFGEVVPHLETVAVEAGTRLIKPELRVRDVWYSGHLPSTPAQAEEFSVWKRRNRMCRTGFWSMGGPFLQNPGDDSTYRLLLKDKFFQSHPEYYSLNANGTRNERFLCMSSPEALAAAAETVIEQFRKHPEEHAFAFSPPDEPVLCQCANCKAAMHGGYDSEGFGDVSDPYFRFVCELADQVGQACPDKWITTMAYYNRCRPPEGVQGKRRNLLIQLASIQQCSVHSYESKHCWSRQEFGQMLKRWAELSAGQVFYEYDPHDWSHLQRPAWRGPGIAEDLRLLKRLGGWGFSNEGQIAWMSTGLNYYLHARLAWDLRQDPAAIESEFCQRFFGPAAAPMLKYYSAIERALSTSASHYPMGYNPDGSADDIYVNLSRPLLDQCESLLQKAERMPCQEPFRTRVAAFRGHFDRINAFCKARTCLAHGEYAEAKRWCLEMLKAVERVHDSALLQDVGPYGGKLCGSNQVAVTTRICEKTDGTKGRLIAVVPINAQFRTDPDLEGVVAGWYGPQAERNSWRTVELTTGWHNQGFTTAGGRAFKGVGWYRCALKIADVPAGKVRLYLPEVRGSAIWLWCNGDFAGYWEQTKSGPREIALASALKPGDNTLVFRVKGEGGLTLPPFLFSPVE